MQETMGFTERAINWIIQSGGLYILLFVIFAETGLFIGFFLPGDSLLFVAGIYVEKLAAEFFNVHYIIVLIVISLAGIAGNFAGYWFGKKSGPLLYKRKDSFFFKHKHLETAKVFYEKNGALTIVAARFMPIIRTFVPIVAGIVGMDYKKFTLYNIIGSFAWVFSMMLAGKFLQSYFLNHYQFDLTKHLEVIVICIILVTTLPVIIKFAMGGKKQAEV